MSCDKLSSVYEAIYLDEPCAKEAAFVPPPAPWARLNSRCPAIASLFSPSELQMRRKAEVLQYKNVAHTSRVLRYVDANRQGRNRSFSFARSLEERCLAAALSDKIWHAPSSASNVPGRMMLYYDRRVPYIPIGKREDKSDEATDYI